MKRGTGTGTGRAGRQAAWAAGVLLAALLLGGPGCGGGGSGGDVPSDAVADSAVDPAADLAADLVADVPGDEAPDGAPEATPDLPADATPEVLPDIPADAVPEVVPDVPADALADASADADAPPLPLWEDLVGTGEPVGRIVGVASHMSNAEGADPQRDFEFDQYVDLPGLRMRRGLRWSTIEPAQDEWHFERVRTPVLMSTEHGVRILPLLAYGNSWAQTDPELYGTLNIADYADFAGHLAAEFCATVKDYEIWNEENITRFWHIPPDPAKYADLLIASAAAIRAACPDARVVFGGMASYDDVDMFDRWGFLRKALAARPEACDAFDAVGLHPYTWWQFDPPEHDKFESYDVIMQGQTWMTTIARDIVAQAGCQPKAILYTEVGWPSYELTEDQVARYAARSLLLAARDGVEGWYWYTFWDDAPDASGVRPHENYFGLWAYPGDDDSVRRPKPAWFAVKTAGTLLGGYRFARDLGPALGLPNDVYVLAFVDDAGHVILALWDGREMPDVTEEGEGEGGPDTTYALDLPLPACATALRALDQDGTVLETPALAPTVHRVLTPRVQYLDLGCGVPNP